MLNWVALLSGLLLASTLPRSTPPAPRAAAAPAERPGLEIGFDVRRDRFRYRFENLSSFDTPFAVPHVFAQSYRVDSRWLVLRARYKVLGRLWETEAGATLDTVGYGDDYDTFFNPGENIVVYGTKADVSIRSWRVRHAISLARVAGVDTWTGYSFRRDRAVFLPSYSTTAQTVPPSFTSFWNAARETTISDVHEVQFGAGRDVALSGTTRLRGRVDLTPIGLARLTTLLPDKYPGEPIVFMAKGPSLSATVSLHHHIGRWTVTATADYVHSWSYRSSNQFHRDSAGIRIMAGFQPGWPAP